MSTGREPVVNASLRVTVLFTCRVRLGLFVPRHFARNDDSIPKYHNRDYYKDHVERHCLASFSQWHKSSGKRHFVAVSKANFVEALG